ncbi:MAG: hypothetical protein FWD35_06115 [Oscillospiraceae bacterium]|nr:hypothetical protein [Oscillospiraceae bacterium]
MSRQALINEIETLPMSMIDDVFYYVLNKKQAESKLISSGVQEKSWIDELIGIIPPVSDEEIKNSEVERLVRKYG